MKKTILLSLLFLASINCAKTKNIESYKYIDFELPKLSSNETIKLSSFVGKNLILLNFWTTWCPYCLREIPELKQLQKKYENKGLKIIAVNISEKETEVSKFVKKQQINYTILLDSKGKVARQYSVRGIPTNFLINLKGEIIFTGHYLPDEILIEKNLIRENKK